MDKQITTPQLMPAVQTLVETIRTEIETGKERAYLAMEQEKKLTYWNVGKHIKQHLLQNEEREDYGKYVISQLANELSLTRAILYESVKCYEEYPRIVHAREQLTWSHIRVLLSVPDKQARQAFEQKVIDENLSSKELQKLVKCDRSVPLKTSAPTLKIERGEPYIYRLKKIQNQKMIDLGFRFYIQNQFADAKDESPQNEAIPNKKIVKTEKFDKNYRFTETDDLKVPHYTYKAYVIEIIDGDTIWVNIDLGFNSWTVQKLRFKGINAKAIETKDGQNAKDYIEARLKGCEFIAIKTYWRDKFTRYLADIFYKKGEGDFLTLVQDGKHLNQELLDRELAVKYV